VAQKARSTWAGRAAKPDPLAVPDESGRPQGTHAHSSPYRSYATIMNA